MANSVMLAREYCKINNRKLIINHHSTTHFKDSIKKYFKINDTYICDSTIEDIELMIKQNNLTNRKGVRLYANAALENYDESVIYVDIACMG